MGVHRLPKDESSWKKVHRHQEMSWLCDSGSLCDEKHMVFECSALQGLHEQYSSLSVEMCTVQYLLWQEVLVSAAIFVYACLGKMYMSYVAICLSNDSPTSD